MSRKDHRGTSHATRAQAYRNVARRVRAAGGFERLAAWHLTRRPKAQVLYDPEQALKAAKDALSARSSGGEDRGVLRRGVRGVVHRAVLHCVSRETT